MLSPPLPAEVSCTQCRPLTSNVKIDADESKVAGVGMHITLDGTGNATAQSSAMLEGAEAMINKLMKRLEDHQLTADLHGKTVSRGSPDRALRMMRKPLSFTNDSSRFHELVHTTRGAARQIFEDTFMLIGDVAIISHDLELIASNDLSHCVERLEDLPAGRPSNSIHSGEMAVNPSEKRNYAGNFKSCHCTHQIRDVSAGDEAQDCAHTKS